MTNKKDLLHNESGVVDPTAYLAIKKVDKERDYDEESKRFYKHLYAIFDMCELTGFTLEGRISLRDRRTGKLWK